MRLSIIAPAVLLSIAPIFAQAQLNTANVAVAPDGTVFTLSATGEVKQKPDIARIRVSVRNRAPTPEEALDENSRRMEKVLAAIRQLGLAEKDIQTEGVSVTQNWKQKKGEGTAEPDGYDASNQISVTVRKLDQLGAIYTGITRSGADNIWGPGFAVENQSPAFDQARALAAKNAHDEAERVAKNFGLRVRRVLSVYQGQSRPSMPEPISDSRSVGTVRISGSYIPQFMPREIKTTVTLNVQYELGP